MAHPGDRRRRRGPGHGPCLWRLGAHQGEGEALPSAVYDLYVVQLVVHEQVEVQAPVAAGVEAAVLLLRKVRHGGP